MGQVNINVTPEFDRALTSLMAARGLTNKFKAIDMAIAEAAERATAEKADEGGVTTPTMPSPT